LLLGAGNAGKAAGALGYTLEGAAEGLTAGVPPMPVGAGEAAGVAAGAVVAGAAGAGTAGVVAAGADAPPVVITAEVVVGSGVKPGTPLVGSGLIGSLAGTKPGTELAGLGSAKALAGTPAGAVDADVVGTGVGMADAGMVGDSRRSRPAVSAGTAGPS